LGRTFSVAAGTVFLPLFCAREKTKAIYSPTYLLNREFPFVSRDRDGGTKNL
jgi:hypothetical protein